VTKGKGKRLRVEVRCNNRFTWQELQLGLVECDNPAAAALQQTDTSTSGQECPDFFVCADRSTIKVPRSSRLGSFLRNGKFFEAHTPRMLG
jgi:hypothetical protein